ncbi:hypothetical protein EVAR_68485_1 [Eumeta japonica]|uniref:Uncharacterized protein n=1 Tax=Eumeta variegata TaxID=151549 RepID=A0A4C2A619_EUMVA|nr:hypothetical protein EVAR_68485_1 [Eumeta japonica]
MVGEPGARFSVASLGASAPTRASIAGAGVDRRDAVPRAAAAPRCKRPVRLPPSRVPLPTSVELCRNPSRTGYLRGTRRVACQLHEPPVYPVRKLHRYSVTDRSLGLLESYLNDRIQRVDINGERSSESADNMSVLQGSVLEQFLFLV